MPKCKHCGSDDIISSHGEMICNECGAVVESDNIVSEVQFQENSAGCSKMVGKYVSYEGGSGTSKQLSVKNAREKIQNLAYQINMTQYVEQAVRYYKLANSKRLTMGVVSDYVAAACLYIVCRIDKKPVMLLDFSDKLKVDVYTLGRIYRKYAEQLHISIPFLDPCLYVERYAHKLQFGGKVKDVCRTANRLVASMCRDWMVEGRRPSGICGAALLIAARIHNFNRTMTDIKNVVKISERTIDKRLKEFEQTESSKMTVEEFEQAELKKLSVDELLTLTETMDPPCYSEGIKRAKLEEEIENMPVVLEELDHLRFVLETEIQEYIQKKSERCSRNSESQKILNDSIATEDLSLTSIATTMEDVDRELTQYEDLLDGVFQRSNIFNQSICNFTGICSQPVSGLNSPAPPSCDDGVEQLVEIMKDNLAGLNELSFPNDMPSMMFKESVNECFDQDLKNEEGILDLDGIDDAELDEMILAEDEVKIRTLRWMRENADYLREKREKDEKKAQELLLNPSKKSRKPRPSRPRATGFNSAGEAIKQILKEKNLSDKINYDELANFGSIQLKRQESCADEFQIKTNMSIVERCPSPPEKKVRLDLMENLIGVQKLEAEPETDGFNENYSNNDEQENQQDEYDYQYHCSNPDEDEFDDYNEYD